MEQICSKTRLPYLDLTKVTAVVAVCALHFSWTGDMEFPAAMGGIAGLRRFLHAICACAVPLFLMVNGALLLNRRLDLRKHYRTLLIISLQYVLWRAVSLLLIGLYQGYDFSAWNLTQAVNVLLLLKEVEGINVNHLWFIPMLICIYVWFPLIKAAWDQCEYSEYGYWLLAPFLGMLLIFAFLLDDLLLFQPVVPVFNAAHLSALRMFQPLSSTLYSSMLFYFLLGGVLERFREKLRAIRPLHCAAGIGLALLLLYWEWRINSRLIGGTYDNIFSSYDNLPDVLLTVSVFLLMQGQEGRLEKRERLCGLLRGLSQESMSVYYFHWILLATVLEVFHVADGLLFNLLRSVLLYLLCAGLSRGMKKLPGLRRLVY